MQNRAMQSWMWNFVASLLQSFLLYNEIVIYTGKMKAQQLALLLGPTLSWKQFKQSMNAA